jgi:hypothetical protein
MNSLRVSKKQQVESSAAPGPIVNVVSHKSAVYSDSAQAKPSLNRPVVLILQLA